ncbi:unnamed protein product [Owenia fusiformis]|uniref:Uncharacterized protein n=1 Tax=Owenia fusiformis TaxID=6347 RepID=A0A8J1UE74_OWEFU|nr:unnamed protein product [Owenia fusiformis]
MKKKLQKNIFQKKHFFQIFFCGVTKGGAVAPIAPPHLTALEEGPVKVAEHYRIMATFLTNHSDFYGRGRNRELAVWYTVQYNKIMRKLTANALINVPMSVSIVAMRDHFKDMITCHNELRTMTQSFYGKSKSRQLKLWNKVMFDRIPEPKIPEQAESKAFGVMKAGMTQDGEIGEKFSSLIEGQVVQVPIQTEMVNFGETINDDRADVNDDSDEVKDDSNDVNDDSDESIEVVLDEQQKISKSDHEIKTKITKHSKNGNKMENPENHINSRRNNEQIYQRQEGSGDHSTETPINEAPSKDMNEQPQIVSDVTANFDAKLLQLQKQVDENQLNQKENRYIIAMLQNQITTQQNDETILKDELTTLKQQQDNSLARIEQLEQMVANYEWAFKDIKSVNNLIKTDVRSMKNTLNTHNTTLSIHNMDISTVHSDLKNMKIIQKWTFDDFKATNRKLRSDMQIIKTAQRTQNDTIEILNDDTNRVKVLVDQQGSVLEAILEGMQTKLKEHNNIHDEENNVVEQIQNELNNLTDTVKSERGHTRAALVRLQEDLAKVHAVRHHKTKTDNHHYNTNNKNVDDDKALQQDNGLEAVIDEDLIPTDVDGKTNMKIIQNRAKKQPHNQQNIPQHRVAHLENKISRFPEEVEGSGEVDGDSGSQWEHILSGLEERDNTIQHEIKELLKEKDTLSNKVGKIEQDITNKDGKLVELNRKILSLTDHIETLEETLQEQNQRTLEEELETFKNIMMNFTEQVFTLDNWRMKSKKHVNITYENRKDIEDMVIYVKDNIAKITNLETIVYKDSKETNRKLELIQRKYNQLNKTVEVVGTRVQNHYQRFQRLFNGVDYKFTKAAENYNRNKDKIAHLEVNYLNASLTYCMENNKDLIQDLKFTSITKSITKLESLGKDARNAVSKFDKGLQMVHENENRRAAEIKSLQTQTAECAKVIPKLKVIEKEVKNFVTQLPQDCSDVFASGFSKSGIYLIKPKNSTKSVQVLCEFEIDGPWTVIQHRHDGSVDFNKTFAEYTNGFGTAATEFWVGLENLHLLTTERKYNLRIDMWDVFGDYYFADYNEFNIGSGKSNYTLTIDGYLGNATESFTYSDGTMFSTSDVDNDASSTHCAKFYTAGWWYKHCHYVNLNGRYGVGIVWFNQDTDDWIELKETVMKIKPLEDEDYEDDYDYRI